MLSRSAARVIVALSVVLAHDDHTATGQTTAQSEAAEQVNLRRTVSALTEAQSAAISAIRPGASERDVWNAIGSTYGRLGLLGAFSVWGKLAKVGVAQPMNAGELLQVRTRVGSIRISTSDTQPFSAGISRTYPVSGTFSAEQREVYLLVSEAELAGIRASRAGTTRSQIERETVEVIKNGLMRLGLITDAASDEYERWYWEGNVNRLGSATALTDTQIDKIARGEIDPNPDWVLAPGVALEISVGVSTWERDGVASLPQNQVLLGKVRPAYDKYKNIRVLLADSFLLTTSGLEQLSSSAPSRAEEVERAMERAQR
jgi:Xaa-Pro aminopeptidase